MNANSPINNILFGKVNIQERYANTALLLLRLYAGYAIMTAGLDKLPLPVWIVNQVTSVGFPIPAFFAWIASFSEFAFGFMLLIGLMTRVSAFILAVTMGVAAFGFQKVMPFTEMHIAQLFFWINVLFIFLGAGKYSVDSYIYKNLEYPLKGITLAAFPVFLVLLTVGLIREYSSENLEKKETFVIKSISVAGSFNDWDPAADEMKSSDKNDYTVKIKFEKSGPVEFKFTANKSWSLNWGEIDQVNAGFPLNGKAEADSGGNTDNIKAYIPAAGHYIVNFNSEKLHYSLDSIKTENLFVHEK